MLVISGFVGGSRRSGGCLTVVASFVDLNEKDEKRLVNLLWRRSGYQKIQHEKRVVESLNVGMMQSSINKNIQPR